ncbi:hypothetical protein [Gordonia sp. NPDC003585]|uniref:hypothetical protein n=1 Tax=Gordonia sp. NPDC003585 TaxID=3154275 RepID=UPI0033B7AAC1
MPTYPTDPDGLIYRRAVIAARLTDDDLRRSVRAGEITSVMRGVFVVAGDRKATEWHRLKAIAYARCRESAAAAENPEGDEPPKRVPLSHQSAAVILGIEMLRPSLRRVHTTAGPVGGFRTDTQHNHAAHLSDDDIIEVQGVLVTSMERTAVDVACTATNFAAALAVFDSALRQGADRGVMRGMLVGRRRGIAQARRALHHADAGAENPGESWSRAQMIEAGFPIARLQREFLDEDGNLVARTDFDWEGKLVGEFDGKVKYKKLLRPGEDPAEVVVREKAREDALRAMGVMVVRWIWKDLEQGLMVPRVRSWLVSLKLMPA